MHAHTWILYVAQPYAKSPCDSARWFRICASCSAAGTHKVKSLCLYEDSANEYSGEKKNTLYSPQHLRISALAKLPPLHCPKWIIHCWCTLWWEEWRQLRIPPNFEHNISFWGSYLMLHQEKWTNLLPRVCPIARTFYGTLNQPSNYQFQTLKLFTVVNLARGELLGHCVCAGFFFCVTFWKFRLFTESWLNHWKLSRLSVTHWKCSQLPVKHMHFQWLPESLRVSLKVQLLTVKL